MSHRPRPEGEVFHARIYAGRKPVLPCDDDKPHRCPNCWSVLYSRAQTPAFTLALEEYRECWHCASIVAPYKDC